MDAHDDVLAGHDSVGVGGDVDDQPRPLGHHHGADKHHREGRAERNELDPACEDPGEHAGDSQRRDGHESSGRSTLELDRRAHRADGAGTPATSSASTSSADTRRTQRSLRRTTRCTSAGMTTSFTSSGVT